MVHIFWTKKKNNQIISNRYFKTHAYTRICGASYVWMTKTDRTLFSVRFRNTSLNSFYALDFQFFLTALLFVEAARCFFNLHTHWLTHRSQFKRVTHFEPKSVICLFQQYSILNISIKNSMCFDLIWRNLSTQPDSFFIVYYNFVITNQKNGVFTNVYEVFVYLLEKFVILYK